MQIDDAASILAGADFFDICTDEELRLLGFASERRSFSAGEVISASGDVPEGAQVLISGTIAVTPDGADEDTRRLVSSPGSVIGIASLVLSRQRAVTIEAVTRVETLAVPRQAFMKLVRQSPHLAELAAERVRQELVGFVDAVTPLGRKFTDE